MLIWVAAISWDLWTLCVMGMTGTCRVCSFLHAWSEELLWLVDVKEQLVAQFHIWDLQAANQVKWATQNRANILLRGDKIRRPSVPVKRFCHAVHGLSLQGCFQSLVTQHSLEMWKGLFAFGRRLSVRCVYKNQQSYFILRSPSDWQKMQKKRIHLSNVKRWCWRPDAGTFTQTITFCYLCTLIELSVQAGLLTYGSCRL